MALVLLVAGVLASAIGGHALQVAGFVAVVIAVALLAAGVPNLIRGRFADVTLGRVRPDADGGSPSGHGGPEYIEEAGEAPAAAGERERELYRERDAETGPR